MSRGFLYGLLSPIEIWKGSAISSSFSAMKMHWHCFNHSNQSEEW